MACGQSLFDRHATHCPSASQSFPGCVEQSVLPRHCTQLDVDVSQRGASAEQPALEVQPGRHWKWSGLQIGLAVPQSELFRHCTHWPSATRHRGWSAGQFALTVHSTHCCVTVSQTPSSPLHGVAVLHPTQTPTPELVSQVGAFFGQSPFEAHAG